MLPLSYQGFGFTAILLMVLILSVVEGALESGSTISQGDNVLLPYGGEFSFAARTDVIVLITEDFFTP